MSLRKTVADFKNQYFHHLAKQAYKKANTFL